ncbi:MAG: response regulator [Zetaproteobacteria bacterium]|nr:MAG: response regulator [Zetaproteobacteria bacterium]
MPRKSEACTCNRRRMRSSIPVEQKAHGGTFCDGIINDPPLWGSATAHSTPPDGLPRPALQWRRKLRRFCTMRPTTLPTALLAALLLLSGWPSAGRAGEPPTWRVAVDAEYAPYEFRNADGDIDGLLPALLRAIGRRAGVRFTFRAMPWPEAVAALDSGAVDLLSMIRTPEREERYLFSDPHSVIEQAIFRNARHRGIHDLASIAGSVVALQRHDIAVEKLKGRRDFKRVLVGSKEEGFTLLDGGRVAAFFAAEQPGLYFLRRHKLPHVELAAVALWPQPYCFATRKSNPQLIALLNDGLRQLKQEGVYDRLAHRWLVKPPGWLEQHRALVITTLILLALLALLFWLSNHRLQLQVRARTREIEAQHQRYRLLFASNHDAVMLLDKHGFIECNPATLELFGCRDESEFLDKHPAELSPPTQPDGSDSRTLADRRIAEALERGTLRFEWVHRRLDDRRDFIAEVTLSAMPDETGALLQATVRDISELAHSRRLRALRQQLTELLLQPHEALGPLMEQFVLRIEQSLPQAICSLLLVDRAGRLHHCAAPNLPQEYCAAIDGTAIGPRAGSYGTAAYYAQRVVVGDIANDPLWQEYRELAARFALAACWSQPIFDDHFRVIGTFAIYYRKPHEPQKFELDVIEMAAELAGLAIVNQRAAIERRRAFSIIETSSDFIGMADADGRALYVNPAGRALLGIAPDADVSTMQLADFHPPDDLRRLQQEGLPRLIAGGEYQTEIRFLHRNGTEIPTMAAFGVQKRSDGSVESFSVIARDIRAEQQRRQQLEHTQRLESLGVLAGGIAHDFNNILTAIMGNAAIAEARLTEAPDEAREVLHKIVASGEKAAALCRQMLAYSGKGRFVIEPLDLSQLVREITGLIEVSLPKSVVLKLQLADDLPLVAADSAQIQQVVMNLVINGAEAIGTENSGIISVETGVEELDADALAKMVEGARLQPGCYVFLEVADTGCGMDEETQERIFEPFFTTKFTGRGLGMSAVLGIVRGHHGALRVHSELGRGTTFRMVLPATEETPSADKAATGAQKEAAWRGGGTVLVVDDEESIREAAAMMLEDAGFRTITAADGEEGVAQFRRHREAIDLVLLDMTMPRMDGRACCDAIRAIDPQAAILLSSGYSEEEATRLFADRTISGFVQKPYTPQRLVAAVRRLMGTRGNGANDG